MAKQTLYVNDAYIPFLKSTQRTQIFYGGSSSGKSFFLAQRVVIDVLEEGRNYLIVRNVGATIRFSTYNQIVKTIQAMGLSKFFKITNGGFAITCLTNGKQILFSGLDDVEKLKSITPAVGVLTDVWIEEATEVQYESYKQLSKRLRGLTGDDDDNIKKRITFSFNPILKTHWIYQNFFSVWEDDKNLYMDDDLLILKTTYKDNKFLAEDDIKALESEKDPYFYEVYTLGNWGVLGKVIFRNWVVEDLTDKIPMFDNIRNGLDFGFSDDPTAMVRAHVDQKRKIIYVFDELYRGGMYLDELSEHLRMTIGSQYITCDSAEPRSIGELNRYGINAIGARKGTDSTIHGIQWLQQFRIVIHKDCQNFKNEVQSYHWQEDKYGNALRRPVDKDNHLIDALRYATEDLQLAGSVTAGTRL